MPWSANIRGGFTTLFRSLTIGSVCVDVWLRCGTEAFAHVSGEEWQS